jgi:hypothetical protein
VRRLELFEQVLVPALILAAGVVVVQAHAIPYWQGAMGAAVGLVASLGAELVGLYLVYQPGRLARSAGLLMVAVMVLVPAWVIAGPEYSAWLASGRAQAEFGAARAEAAAKLPALEQDIAAQDLSLRKDEAKSEVRSGWLPELQRERQALETKRAERLRLKGVQAAPAPAGYDYWAAAPKVLPVLALLVAFQLVNAYSVLRISGFRHRGLAVTVTPQSPVKELVTDDDPEPVTRQEVGSAEPPVTPRITGLRAEPVTAGQGDNRLLTEPVMEASDHNRLPAPTASSNQLSELELKRLQRIVRDGVQADGLNGFARRCRVNKRYLWLLLNDEGRRRAGKEGLSNAALLKLAARFLPSEQGEGQA